MKYTFEFQESYDVPGHGYYKFFNEYGELSFPPQGVTNRPESHWCYKSPAGDQNAQAVCEYMEWYDALPVEQRSSRWLTEIRTVHSRAVDAIRRLVKKENGDYVHPHDWTEDQLNAAVSALTEEDRDIVVNLHFVATFLRWAERTGRPPKYPGGNQ